MRHLAVFLAAAACACAADFQTGQAARAVIGQATFTDQLPDYTVPQATLPIVLGGVSGLAYVNGSLFVVDSNRVDAAPQNHRVVMFSNIGSQVPGPTAEIDQTGVACPVCQAIPNLVLGQAAFTFPSGATQFD